MSAIIRDIGAALHHQISAILRSAIMSGEYGRGGALPGESALIATYGVSRATVRRALDTLEREKLIERHQGKATRVLWVRPAVIGASMAQHRRRIERNARDTDVIVLEFGTAHPPSDVRGALALDDKAQAVRILRLRRRAGTPLWYLTNYLPLGIAAAMTREELERGTLIAALARAGHVVHRAEDEVGATLATPVVASTLDVAVGAPLIEVTRIMYDRVRTPIAYQRALIPPERHKLQIVVQGDEEEPVGPAAEPGTLQPVSRAKKTQEE
jgi:GntR family transcriptional regulator